MNAPLPKTQPAQTLVQRALGGHAAIGLLVSALLYIVAISGSIIVIHDRWQRWEQPNVVEMEALSPAAAQAAIAAGAAASPGKPATTHLYLRMPDDAMPRAVVTTDHGAWYVDRAGRIVAREAHSWTEFVITLHEYLHLPMTWGLILCGALGIALASLLVTGVLAHPRIIRDAFCLRTRHDAQIARADWHNRIGVWTLPFALAIALTGAVIGLGSVGFGVLANAYTGGDLEAAYAPVYGHEPEPDATPAPLPDVAAALNAVRARVPDSRTTYAIVHDPGTRGQHVQIIAAHPRRLIYGETYTFDATGRWTGPVGLSDGSLGQQAAASTYNLHFGNYGGLPVELIYTLLGIGMCVVTATGVTLWLGKRRRRGLGNDRLDAAWGVIVWGTPLMIVAAAWLRAAAGPDAPLVALFWTGLVGSILLAGVRPRWMGAERLRAALLASMAATGIGHFVLLRPAAAGVIAIDLAMVIIPILTWAGLRSFRSSTG